MYDIVTVLHLFFQTVIVNVSRSSRMGEQTIKRIEVFLA